MPAPEIEVLFEKPMQLGETPLWHPEEKVLYWIDIAGLAVHRYDPAQATHRSWAVPSEPGCIARSATGCLIVAMRSGIAMLDTESGRLTEVIAAPYDPSGIRFNDGRCDSAGRLWVGSLSDRRDLKLGSLYCAERGKIRDAKKPVTVSNGVAFSPDEKTIYHADTTAHRILAYEFDIATGSIGNSRQLIEFSSVRGPDYGGRPDGAAVDCEGAYWCAMYEGGKLLRISPSGDVLREIALPVRCPTMLAFGGDDLRTLYITSARANRSTEELDRHPLSGCVLALRVDVQGRPENAYIA